MKNEGNFPRVLVLLATYNGAQWCLDQLRSILNQKDVILDIYVSDDLSIDSTIEIIASLKDPRIKFLPSKSKFGSACQNFFRLLRDLDISEYDYIAFSDQDDIWNMDKLSYSIDKIVANGVDAFSSNVTALWPNGSTKLIAKSQPQREWDYLFESAGPGCTFLLTQKLACDLADFLRVNILKTQDVALHDWFTYAFARCNDYSWWIDSQPTIMYRQHDANEFGANNGPKAALSRFKKTMNGWYRKQILLIGELVGASNSWPFKRMLRFSIVDRVVLAFNVAKFRRAFLNRVVLFFLLLLPQSDQS